MHPSKSVGDALGVAILAAGAGFGAAGDGIPGYFRPFDLGTLRHKETPFFIPPSVLL